MTVVGIIGGGQLARMLALAAAPMGIETHIYDPSPDACARFVARQTCAAFDDHLALAAFARQVDVVTFDFENVPATALASMAGQYRIAPNPRALAVSQDRFVEKSTFQKLGMAVPAYRCVDDRQGLDDAVNQLGFPCVVKTRRLGYDGKGQYWIRQAEDISTAWRALGAQAATVGLIAEAGVRFEREVSMVAVRNEQGEFASWPLIENWHVGGVLSASLAPAPQSDRLTLQALHYAQTLANYLEYVGTFALEFFVHNGQLLANEMAPRVHNSGHWTIEGAEVSQFENHLRALLNWPLGATTARGHTCMLNWLGTLPDRHAFLGVAGSHWHDYGKQARRGRKIGHGTLCRSSLSDLVTSLVQVGKVLERSEQVAPVLARVAASEKR